MAFTPYNFTEWHFNSLLVPLFILRSKKIRREKKREFRGWVDYMLISRDWELAQYSNLNYRPRRARDLDFRKELVENFERQGIDIAKFGVSFLPDAVLLDQYGKPYIFEIKKDLTSKKACNELVLQALIYTNTLLLLSYKNQKLFGSSYGFLDLLYRAHWFIWEYDDEYTNLKEKYAKYFCYKTIKKVGTGSPIILFGLINPRIYILQRLIEACKLVKKLSYINYKRGLNNIVTSGCKFMKRVDEIEDNWEKLQKIEFSVLPINLSVLESTIEERYVLVK